MQLPRNPGNTTKRLHLTADSGLPSVDVILPCCGEPLDIILDTIRAACVLDYPQSAFRVLVLDDGNSTELQHAVEELRQTWPNLRYYSRGIKPSRKVFAKAGNLNHAIFNIQGKMKQPPDFIAGFDADFLPAPNFLRATLPHILEDPSVGLVGPMQDYYNLPRGDPLSQSMGVFRETILPELNEQGSSIASGSGFLMRRQLALDVGGFPTLNEAEDITLSLILPSIGKRVLALEETLQLGQVPPSLEGHIRQRRRWITSMTHMIATPWAAHRESAPYASRSSMVALGLTYLLSPVNHVVGCVTISLALISQRPLVPSGMLRLQLALSLANFALVWLYEWIKAAAVGFRQSVFALQATGLWMCADRLYTLVRFHFFGSQAGRALVTGSAQNSWNDPNKVSTRVVQLKRDLWDAGVFYNVLFVLGTLAGLIYSIMGSIESTSGWHIHAMTTLLCPPVILMCYISLSCHIIPVLCVIWRPHYPSREEVMDTHPSDARAVFPSKSVRKYNVRQRMPPLGYCGHLLLIPVYVTLMAMFCLLYL
ncbi:nucleotide-diphospho-sugar transferase [Aspergillus steynii IBT 23096]|uniref:Nucleotide-diphospho-sugar transferase n=1 Tax=Aspergillus steynii IBT 23096 TaxID=1392250 RepID=A0A2I2G4E3_9EURO|nr:nucleotide-diphospho-sugar transferase [Aspergillus steynii IBT 23096]PLB47738.1 nucleotide-diphospho-sugar transferase [Aspergillus steynii IBT 23096]